RGLALSHGVLQRGLVGGPLKSAPLYVKAALNSLAPWGVGCEQCRSAVNTGSGAGCENRSLPRYLRTIFTPDTRPLSPSQIQTSPECVWRQHPDELPRSTRTERNITACRRGTSRCCGYCWTANSECSRGSRRRRA